MTWPNTGQAFGNVVYRQTITEHYGMLTTGGEIANESMAVIYGMGFT